MILRNVVLPGLVVPVVATATVLCAFLLARGESASLRRGAAGVGVAVGFLAAFVATSGWPRWPPVEATQRLFFLLAGIALVSWLVARRGRHRADPWLTLAALALLLSLILQTPLRHSWSPPQAILWIGGLLVGTCAVAAAMRANLRGGTLLTAAVRLTLIVGIAVLLALSDSFRLAQLAGALACGMATVELFAGQQAIAWYRSDALVLTLTVVGLLLVGYFYAGLETIPAILATVALLLLGVSASQSRWLQLLPLLPLGLALGLAVVGFLAPQEDSYENWAALGTAATHSTALAELDPAYVALSGNTSVVAQ